MEYDVLVCGGGIAGISAALASARRGAKTCLLEKGYALGGLATLGLIVVYLPLCDGAGTQMTAGIAEELLKLSIKFGPGSIPQCWRDNTTQKDERYLLEYNPASLIIAAEQLLVSEGVEILYDARISGVGADNNKIDYVVIETKTGKQNIYAKSFIDATGDGDVCYFAGEKMIDEAQNSLTGWYYSYDGENISLHKQTQPYSGAIPKENRLYSGTDIKDISEHLINSRRMIMEHIDALNKSNDKQSYPLIIPTFHGLRMTRRIDNGFEFSEDKHEDVWFDDAIGMIGNWKYPNKRYVIPYRTIIAVKNANLYVAGRCVSSDKSGWDLTRVIPTCAVTGEAAGVAAAMQSLSNYQPDIKNIQNILLDNGVLIDKTLFTRKEEDL